MRTGGPTAAAQIAAGRLGANEGPRKSMRFRAKTDYIGVMTMKTFSDAEGGRWVASAREEDTPRHHGRWYLVFHPQDDDVAPLVMPEVRWQTEATAARTLHTMSDFELRRRLQIVRGRTASTSPAQGPGPSSGASAPRERTNVSAG
jgi:hypothetical protein